MFFFVFKVKTCNFAEENVNTVIKTLLLTKIL